VTALANLSQEELYLWGILNDPTGVDIYEFIGVNNEGDGPEPARLWDFQWPWMHADGKYQISATSRQLGKSWSVAWRAMAFAFQAPRQEMLFVAPQQDHLDLLMAKVEEAFDAYRLMREMRAAGPTAGLKRAPHWQLSLKNGAVMITRLGSNPNSVKGPHPVRIEVDEVQDIPVATYMEMVETIKTHAPGMKWWMHGVTKGVGQDLHYRLTQKKNHAEEIEGPDWRVHHYIAAHRPTWNDEERETKIRQYGSDENHPDYQRNVLGLPADAGNSLFVMARLMACVRQRESEWALEYNEQVYTRIKIADSLVARVSSIEALVDIPVSHLRDEYISYWGGADIGFTNDPTEILIFGTTKAGVDRLLTRVQLVRVSAKDQVAVIRHLFSVYGAKLRRFGMDRTGVGLPLFQELQEVKEIAERVAGYNFSENRAVGFEDREMKAGEKQEDLVIKRNIKDYATDILRKWVDQKKLELPRDEELLQEWGGATSYIVKTAPDQDGVKRKYGSGALHTLDGARMYAAAKDLMAIEEILNATPKQAPVLDRFVF